MQIRILPLALLALFATPPLHAATVSADLGSFTLTYDDSTVFGAPSTSFSGGGGLTGVIWSVPGAVSVYSAGPEASASFALPDFTIAAKPGWSLSGPISGFLGNLVFNEFGAGVTSASASGTVSLNGAPGVSGGGPLTRVVTTADPGFTAGHYAGTALVPVGTFSSLSLSGGVLTLGAEGPGFASIVAQPQNELKLSLFATPVPEPENFALFLAGLGLVGAIAAKRRQAA